MCGSLLYDDGLAGKLGQKEYCGSIAFHRVFVQVLKDRVKTGKETEDE
jgi:hypothetical protein